MHDHKFQSAGDAREFTLAGKATVTLESKKTGAHFTYRVRQAEDRRGNPTNLWFVSAMTGPDNEASYSYIGCLRKQDGAVIFGQTAKSKLSADAPSVKAFTYFWRQVSAGVIPECLVVRHANKCGRCNRKLTTPESIDRGIGPECAERMGIAA